MIPSDRVELVRKLLADPAGLSHRQVARIAGVARQTVARIDSGEYDRRTAEKRLAKELLAKCPSFAVVERRARLAKPAPRRTLPAGAPKDNFVFSLAEHLRRRCRSILETDLLERLGRLEPEEQALA